MGRSRSETADVWPSRWAELITITAWNLNPTGRLDVADARQEEPRQQCSVRQPVLELGHGLLENLPRGVSTIHRTTGSISGR